MLQQWVGLIHTLRVLISAIHLGLMQTVFNIDGYNSMQATDTEQFTTFGLPEGRQKEKPSLTTSKNAHNWAVRRSSIHNLNKQICKNPQQKSTLLS